MMRDHMLGWVMPLPDPLKVRRIEVPSSPCAYVSVDIANNADKAVVVVVRPAPAEAVTPADMAYPVTTFEHLKEAFTELVTQKGTPAARKILTAYGAKKLTDLPTYVFNDVLKAAQFAIAEQNENPWHDHRPGANKAPPMALAKHMVNVRLRDGGIMSDMAATDLRWNLTTGSSNYNDIISWQIADGPEPKRFNHAVSYDGLFNN